MTSGDESYTDSNDLVGAGSVGCLFLVGSYTDTTPSLEPAVARAAQRILMSPTLGDFIELRFIDLGPRPGPHSDRAVAVAQITDELTQPEDGADRKYLALMICDNSAAVVDRIIEDCHANPVVGKLPIRWRGLASKDDLRAGSRATSKPGREWDIAFASAGTWSHDAMVAELRRYADDLLWIFAVGREPY